MNIIVTTAQSGAHDFEYFHPFLQDSGFHFIERGRRSLEEMAQTSRADGIIVCYREGPVLYNGTEKFFFHPSMAKNRLSLYRKKGIEDPFVGACRFEAGDEILDCTLGLGADAIMSAYFAPAGRVVGLESSPAIAQVVKWGMRLYNSRMSWLNEAVHRIEAVNQNHYDYLQGLDDNSFDVVYFDPMFRRPLLKSQAISPLRLLANHAPLELKAVTEACRVARKRVVIKELASGTEFERLGCTAIIGGKHRKIVFGVIEV